MNDQSCLNCPDLQADTKSQAGSAALEQQQDYNRQAAEEYAKNSPSRHVRLQQSGQDWSLSWQRPNIVAGLALGVFALLWTLASSVAMYLVPLLQGHFTLQRCLMGLPFLLAGAALLAMGLFSLFGKIRLEKQQHTLKYFVGVGSLGIRQSFDLQIYRRLKVVQSCKTQYGVYSHCVQLRAGESSGEAAAKELLATLPQSKAYRDFLHIAGFLLQRLDSKN